MSDLSEKVARYLCAKDFRERWLGHTWSKPTPEELEAKVKVAVEKEWPDFTKEADAVLSLVIEECARVAESFDWYSAGMPSSASNPEDVEALSHAIATEVRALHPKEPS